MVLFPLALGAFGSLLFLAALALDIIQVLFGLVVGWVLGALFLFPLFLAAFLLVVAVVRVQGSLGRSLFLALLALDVLQVIFVADLGLAFVDLGSAVAVAVGRAVAALLFPLGSIMHFLLFALVYRFQFFGLSATVSRWGAASPTPRCAVSSEGNRAAAKAAWHRRPLACQ